MHFLECVRRFTQVKALQEWSGESSLEEPSFYDCVLRSASLYRFCFHWIDQEFPLFNVVLDWRYPRTRNGFDCGLFRLP
jgi:hypothetical protein